MHQPCQSFTFNIQSYSLRNVLFISLNSYVQYLQFRKYICLYYLFYFIFPTDDLLRHDPKLFLKVTTGPVTPYQFRLYGPTQWSGARAAIMGQWDRTFAPLRSRPLPSQDSLLGDRGQMLKFGIFLMVVFIFRYLFLSA